MSIFLGFNSNRIVTILVGLIGVYISTLLDGSGFYSYIRYILMAASAIAVVCILATIVYEFSKYIHHYRKYTKVKSDWDTDLLRTHLQKLEKHYDAYLVKRIYFYIPYRNMIEEIKVILERA